MTSINSIETLMQLGNKEEIARLLEEGLLPIDYSEDGRPIIVLAASYGQARLVELLLQKGAQVNARSSSGFLPVHSAAINGHLEVIQILADHGADLSIPWQKYFNRNVLHLAAEYGQLQMLPFLMSHSELDLNTCDECGLKAIDLAQRNQHHNVKYVLNNAMKKASEQAYQEETRPSYRRF